MQHPSFQSFRICHNRISLHLKQALLSRQYRTSTWRGSARDLAVQAEQVTTLNFGIRGSSRSTSTTTSRKLNTVRRITSITVSPRTIATIQIQKAEIIEPKMPPNFLPSHRLLARAFYRVPVSRPVSTSASLNAWEGKKPEDHAAREKDSHNVQHDAVKEGKNERAQNEGSRGATEKSEGSNEKAKREFPEAPDTIGMQDERGGKQ